MFNYIGLFWTLSCITVWLTISEIQYFMLHNNTLIYPVFLMCYIQSSGPILFYSRYMIVWLYDKICCRTVNQIETPRSINASINNTILDIVNNKLCFKILYLALPYVLSNIFQAYGYLHVKVSTNTVLFQVNSIFTYLIAIIFFNEKFYISKLIAILISLCGVIIIVYAESDKSFDFNYFLLFPIGSALAVAIYSSLYNYYFSNETYEDYDNEDENVSTSSNKPDNLTVLSHIGLLSSILLLPALIILHCTGVDKIPNFTFLQALPIPAVGFMVAFYNLLYGIALTHASSVFVNVVLIIGIPLSILVDALYLKKTFDGLFYGGTALIIVGFLIMLRQSSHSTVLEDENILLSPSGDYTEIDEEKLDNYLK